MKTGSKLLAIAVALLVVVGVSPLYALADDNLVPVPDPSILDPDDISPELEAEIKQVKKLILALPRNPYVVEESDRAAIEEAWAAYKALPAKGQQVLDADKTPAAQSYGRTIESLMWALDSLNAVDDTTTLADGTYTTQVTSTCSLGKSDSARNRVFHIVEVIVKDGHAQALIEHDTSTTDTVRTGSKEYKHVNTDENAHSQFLVPINLNEMFHISQFAKNATENTVGIVYEMEVKIDEQNAKPDVPPADPSGSGSSASADPSPASQDQSSAVNGARNSSSALSAVAQAKQAGTVGNAKNTTVTPEKKDEKTTEAKKSGASTSASSKAASASDAVEATGAAEDKSDEPISALPFTFGMLGASTALGVGGFTAVFYRRESRLIPWLRSV